ncbi:hypothetical protein LOTGIDRAFT_98649, partial [Lottia gigantea]
WAAYNNLGNLGYIHQTVNHTQNFVNPVKGIQLTEGMWQKAKNKMKTMHGTSREFIADY